MISKTLMAVFAATALFVPAAFAETVNITFLLTSDIYNFDAGKAGRGGFARLNAVVKAERTKGGQVIYVHAGDMISPSLLSGTQLTRKDIFTELPFGNKTVKLEVTGEAIWAALENGFGEVENGAGRFPQVSGLAIEADFNQPKGSRVLSVTIGG